MLIRVKTVASDGTVLSDDIHDRDKLIETNQVSGGWDRPLITELRRALRRRESYRIAVMGGMYCEISYHSGR